MCRIDVLALPARLTGTLEVLRPVGSDTYLIAVCVGSHIGRRD